MKTLLLFFVVVMFVGCATIPQGITPSSSPLVSPDGKSRTYEVVGKSEGSAGHFTLFGFIPFGRADIDEAINEAISPYQGDNLINVHYYVNSSFYFIGNYTSITVKGDVIKYTENNSSTDIQPSENRSVDSNDTPDLRKPTIQINKSYHKLTIGSAVDGFAIDYTFLKPINDFLFYSFSLGYKNFVNKGTIIGYYNSYDYYTNSYQYYPMNYNYENEFSAFPLCFNLGVNAKKIIDIPYPIDPYASIGVAYIPSLVNSNVKFDQVGVNINIGAEYQFVKNFAVGLDYRYIKSFLKLPENDNKGIGFSNLNASLVYFP